VSDTAGPPAVNDHARPFDRLPERAQAEPAEEGT
jgi:hypothetical protein